jgi:TolB-like protein
MAFGSRLARAIIASWALGCAIGAQTLPVIAIADFDALEVEPSHSRVVRDLVSSFLSEDKAFRVIAVEDREALLAEIEFALSGLSASEAPRQGLLKADYFVTGSLSQIEGRFVLSMDFIKAETGQKRSSVAAYDTMNDLFMGSRDQVLILVKGKAAAKGDVYEGAITASVLAGYWMTDDGLNSIRIYPNGAARAYFPNGQFMELEMAIEKEGSVVTLSQSSPNRPEFYMVISKRSEEDPASFVRRSLPLATARAIAEKARPTSWRLVLSADAKVMRGIKRSVSVTLSRSGELVSLNNEYEKEATLTRE